MPLNQVANVTLVDPRTIGVQPWEKKMVPVRREGDPGFRPRTESRRRSGDMIRVPMPALTEERRKELIKVVHKEARTRASRCATCAATRTSS